VLCAVLVRDPVRSREWVEAPGDLVGDAVGDGEGPLDEQRDLLAFDDVLPVVRGGAVAALLLVVGVDRRDVLGRVVARSRSAYFDRPEPPARVKRSTWSRLSATSSPDWFVNLPSIVCTIEMPAKREAPSLTVIGP
jgi:hypothetical protein